MKSFIYKCFIGGSVALSMTLSSCLGDLDLKPIDDNVIQLSDFKDNPQYYTQLLAKVYAGLAVSGQEGPAGNPDIQGFDEGQAQYLRAYWNLQELPTDEAVLGWNDAGLPELSMSTWSAANGFVYVMYSRVFFQIALCNDFLRNTTPTALAANDVPEDVAAQIQTYRAEARVLRTLSYWHAIDLFGAVSFVTEENKIMEAPKQKSRAEIYQFILDELNAVEESIPLQPQYGRVGRDAVNMIRAKLYLNAEVYTGTAQWQNAMDYAEKVINNGYYHLCTEGATNPVTGEVYSAYQMLFLADNNTNGAQYENIFPILFDGVTTKSYGGMNFLVLATYNSTMDVTIPSGTNCSWGKCARVRKQLLDKFYTATPPAGKTVAEMTAPANDDRALFYGDGFSASIKDETDATAGFACVKFRNVRSDGQSNQVVDYVNADLPFFRVAEAYLIYAEASTRLNGSNADAKEKINELRSRANAAQKNLYTLDDICDEWAREFWFEGRRRMDLIRFNKYAGQASYKWEWMGGTYEGAQFSNIRAIFALPENDLANNSNLIQNPGY